MTVVSVKQAASTWTGRVDEEGNNHYEVLFFVTVDSLEDGVVTVLSADAAPYGKLPVKGQMYHVENEVDLYAYVSNVSASRRSDAPLTWEVTVEYATSVDSTDSPTPPSTDDTLDDAIELDDPTVRISFSPTKRVWLEDLDGESMETSAGEPFDPVERDEHELLLYVERNELAFPGLKIQQYMWTINLAEFMGWPTGCCRIDDISARRARKGGCRYWRVSYTFHFRIGGFQEEFANRGFYSLVESTGRQVDSTTPAGTTTRYVRVTDADGVQVEHPVWLNEYGGVAEVSESAPDPVKVYLSRRFNYWADFEQLGMPSYTLYQAEA